MAGMYGDFTAKNVEQKSLNIVSTGWTHLGVGSTPKAGRRQIKIFVRGKAGNALAVAYSNINADSTFTTPTTDVRHATVYPGNSIFVEPLSDKVAIYGRLLNKIAATESSLRVIVTEYQ